MTYLIALIIAIALGAVIALLSFVNIGSGFSGQSAAAKAQQFAQAGSQLEVAMSAYRASEAASAFVEGNTDPALRTLQTTVTELLSEEWIKEAPVSPVDGVALQLVQGASGLYLVLDGSELSADICNEIVDLSGSAVVSFADATNADAALRAVEAADELGLGRLSCSLNGLATPNNVAVFKVE